MQIEEWDEFTPEVRERGRKDVLIEVEVLRRVLREMQENIQKCA